MAEGILRAELARRGVAGVTVGSAGTGAWDGAPASEGTYLVGVERGLDFSGHRARALTRELVAGADLVLTMSRSHRQRVAELGGAERVHLLGEYAGLAGADAEVPDPYGGDLEEYRRTFDRLEAMLGAIAGRLAARGTP